MAITPQTEIKLLHVPLSIDNKNQLTFQNKTAQFNYFNNLQKLEIDECSYQRKDNIIRFPAHIDGLLAFNYCMYKNENYIDKWFYAFIVNMRYVNDGMTEITIATDVWQTWQFDINFKQCFVEREMINLNEDIPGANLIPEGLETGEYKIEGSAEFDELEPYWCIAYIGDSIGDIKLFNGGYIVNGIASSINFIICTNLDSFNTILTAINISGNGDKIITCFSIPKLSVQSQLNDTTALPLDGSYLLGAGGEYYESPVLKSLISLPVSLDGYTPRNQKLRTYPYTYLGFNPSNGTSKIFRYENFLNFKPSFKIYSEVNPNPSVYFIPQNYRGNNDGGMSDIVSLNGYPTLSSSSDHFNTWLAQNSQMINLGMSQNQSNYTLNQINSGYNALNGIIGSTGNYNKSNNKAGVVNNALSDIGNNLINMTSSYINYDFSIKQQMAQIEQQKMLPDTGNLSSSNATLIGYKLNDKNIFTRYSIKAQFAKRIDQFFDMYGYLTNEVKIPNLNNRPNWNYVKTIGCFIEGSVPQDDLSILRNLFDNGITLWHNPNTFLNYSTNNRTNN